jgi:hypothetical protein
MEVGKGSLPALLRHSAEGASDEGHDRPSRQHTQKVNGNYQEGYGSGDGPIEEFDCDDVRVLHGEDSDHSQESQQDDRLDESHGWSPAVCSIIDHTASLLR